MRFSNRSCPIDIHDNNQLIHFFDSKTMKQTNIQRLISFK